MRVTTHILVIPWVVIALGCHGELPSAQTKMEIEAINFSNLPAIRQPFRITPYVRVAAQLQKLGKAAACERLTSVAMQSDDRQQVTILCRMLFSKRQNLPFRSAYLGQPVYLGGTVDDDWPLAPLELVDGVPFFVVYGYKIGGTREPSVDYLDYCVKNCEWSTTKFENVNDKTVKGALDKLLRSDKWKAPLTEVERRFLISQTE
jgi:hypothetical protein